MEHEKRSLRRWIELVETTLGKLTLFQKDLINQFKLDLGGIHGANHWVQVYKNGARLARSTGGNVDVIRWFALLHDACRQSNGADIDHGPRAAILAWRYKSEIDLSPDACDLLIQAVSSHSIGSSAVADVTVQTCIDADRLDLVRLGIKPDTNKLYTSAAKDEIIQQDKGRWAAKFPLRVECLNCRKKLKAIQPGKFQCPMCQYVTEVDIDGLIII